MRWRISDKEVKGVDKCSKIGMNLVVCRALWCQSKLKKTVHCEPVYLYDHADWFSNCVLADAVSVRQLSA